MCLYESLQEEKKKKRRNLLQQKFLLQESNCCNKALSRQKDFVAYYCDKVCDNRLLQQKSRCNRVLF